MKKKQNEIEEYNIQEKKSSKLTQNITDTLGCREDVNRHVIVPNVPNLLLELSVLRDQQIQVEIDNEKARALIPEQTRRIQLLQPMYYRLASVSLLFGVKGLREDDDDKRWYKIMQKKYDIKAEKRDSIIYSMEMQERNHEVQQQDKIEANNLIQERKNDILRDFNLKIREIRVQCLLIKDLIDRVRVCSDEWNFTRVLDHWEVTNNKMLRKYPEDYVINQD